MSERNEAIVKDLLTKEFATAEDFFELEKWFKQPEVDTYNSLPHYNEWFGRPGKEIGRSYGGATWGFSNIKAKAGLIWWEGPFKFTYALKEPDDKPFIFRGYPEFKEEQPELTSNDTVFPYYDGQRVNLFITPRGEFYGRTDWQETLRRMSCNTINFEDYFDEIPDVQNIKDMVHAIGDDYSHSVYGIFYGKDMSSVQLEAYDKEFRFIVTHIVDHRTYKYLPLSETQEICKKYGVDVIEHHEMDSQELSKFGGYLIHRQDPKTLEIEYFAERFPNVALDKRKAIVVDLWNQL